MFIFNIKKSIVVTGTIFVSTLIVLSVALYLDNITINTNGRLLNYLIVVDAGHRET